MANFAPSFAFDFGGGDGSGFQPHPPTASESLAHNPNHVPEGLDLLLEQFKRKDLIEGVLAIYLRQIQALEDAFWSLLTDRWIENAVGEQLDLIGRIVNLPRDAWGDPEYRMLLRVTVQVLRSKGRAEDLIKVCAALFGGAFVFRDVEDLDPIGDTTNATAEIEAFQAALPYKLELFKVLFRRVRAAGVRLLFSYVLHPAEETFAFSDTDEPEDGSAFGLGDVLDPSIGGKLASILQV